MNYVDDILDQTLDDIADLPEFKPYPAGVHKVLVTFTSKEVNKRFSINVECKMIETIELSNINDEAPAAGDTASCLCMLDNEIGAGFFKLLATPLGVLFNTGRLREIIAQTKDVECIIVTTQDKEGKYMNIKELAVV